jgi:polar amino acid transport system substrate-binding protein
MRTLLLCLVLALCGCPQGGASAAGNDALDKAKARGELIVAIDAGYVPFEVINPDGTYSGFDIEIAKEVGKDLGLKIKFENVTWTGIIPALTTGKVDMIHSGMSITPERAKAVDFSEPYYLVGQVFLKRKGDERFKSYKDLNQEGIVISTQEGTTGETACRELFPKATLLRFGKVDQACVAVTQKKADVTVFDLPGLLGYLKERKDSGLVGVWEPFTREPLGAAFRKDSPKLRAAFDATLARLRKSGRYAELRKEFGLPDTSKLGEAPAKPATKTGAKTTDAPAKTAK